MTSTVPTPETSTSPAAVAAPPEASGTMVPTAPVVEKKKRKFSKGLKGVQKMERAVTKATGRVARAIAKGVADYRERSDASSYKKRDGALRDLNKNVAKSLSKALRTISNVPKDLAKGLDGKRARKRMRRSLKVTSRILRPIS